MSTKLSRINKEQPLENLISTKKTELRLDSNSQRGTDQNEAGTNEKLASDEERVTRPQNQ